jgi:enolase
MIVKEVSARSILDSRKDKTILVNIKTNVGSFSASAPNGKSRGKKEAKPYRKSLDGDIKNLEKMAEYFSEEILENFADLKRIEDIVEGHVGANTMFALESAVLKAMAKEQKKEIWELIGPKVKGFPRFVGNVVGGGKHSSGDKKPDFQEFLLIPNSKSPKESFETMLNAKKKIKGFLEEGYSKFTGNKTDENAWMTSLNEKEVLDVLKKVKLPLGVDIAASSFLKRKKYNYDNPKLQRTSDEQIGYLSNLVKNFGLFYIEDPFGEEDFESFAKFLKKFPNSLVVGDDLTVTSSKRLKKAIDMKSINAIIVKPNQCGSLLEVKRVCDMAKENDVKIIFSHRSGETEEDILSDLAFGFGADFMKCGIDGSGREVKIKRLIEIEKSLR